MEEREGVAVDCGSTGWSCLWDINGYDSLLELKSLRPNEFSKIVHSFHLAIHSSSSRIPGKFRGTPTENMSQPILEASTIIENLIGGDAPPMKDQYPANHSTNCGSHVHRRKYLALLHACQFLFLSKNALSRL